MYTFNSHLPKLSSEPSSSRTPWAPQLLQSSASLRKFPCWRDWKSQPEGAIHFLLSHGGREQKTLPAVAHKTGDQAALQSSDTSIWYFLFGFFKTLDSFSCEVQRRQPILGHQEQTCDQKIKWDNKKNKSRKKMQWLSMDFLMTESAMQILPETAGSWKILPLLMGFFLCFYEGNNLKQGMRSTLVYICWIDQGQEGKKWACPIWLSFKRGNTMHFVLKR